jgi:hypothetical protein
VSGKNFVVIFQWRKAAEEVESLPSEAVNRDCSRLWLRVPVCACVCAHVCLCMCNCAANCRHLLYVNIPIHRITNPNTVCSSNIPDYNEGYWSVLGLGRFTSRKQSSRCILCKRCVVPWAGLDAVENRQFLTQPDSNSDPSVVLSVACLSPDCTTPFIV